MFFVNVVLVAAGLYALGVEFLVVLVRQEVLAQVRHTVVRNMGLVVALMGQVEAQCRSSVAQ